MIIRDRIKAYIRTQIEDYVETGARITFENENRNSTSASPTPSTGYEWRESYNKALEWSYKFDITVIKSLGERVEKSYSIFVETLENYRKIIGADMASNEPISEFSAFDNIILKAIPVFAWEERDKNIEVKITLEYIHIEEYNG
ncbi:MAG TPA: hypothetical protein PLM72_07405 [Spirochaetota bacterium]|nr:hypothetical protein [Spirochaetota bacterium]